MKIPKFLPKNGTIGLVAPSFGANIEPYTTRLKAAIQTMTGLGYKIKPFGDIFGYFKGASEDKRLRANHFMDAYKDPNVDVIWSVGGGEMMVEILPYIDFEHLKSFPPKLFIGYSDNTNLTLTLTTKLDMYSVYAENFTSFGMKVLDPFLVNTLKIVSGDFVEQQASKFHEPKLLEDKEPLSSYTLSEPTKWINVNKEEIHLTGRLIGGVMDVLLLHLGTPYDAVSQFLKKYKDEGIIWYLEAFSLDVFAFKRALWQLKEAGWFKYSKGFLFGRHLNTNPILDIDQYNAATDILGKEIPMIMEMDIGHINPMMTLINGAKVTVVNTALESKLILEKE